MDRVVVVRSEVGSMVQRGRFLNKYRSGMLVRGGRCAATMRGVKGARGRGKGIEVRSWFRGCRRLPLRGNSGGTGLVV